MEENKMGVAIDYTILIKTQKYNFMQCTCIYDMRDNVYIWNVKLHVYKRYENIL